MLLGQVKTESGVVAAVFEHGLARPIPAHTMIDLVKRSEVQNIPLSRLADQLATRHAEPLAPVLPIHPPEVYGCGCTYEASSSFRDAEHGTREGMYAYVYREERPEIFFKGTARVCAGPGQGIGIRSDSRFTAAEPELAVVLGSRGRIAGFTLANDVSAWDIERENALYLPQSKLYDSCCALGPAILPFEDLADPYKLVMTCSITRNGSECFRGTVPISKLHRKFETLISFLTRSNRVPVGTVVMTGTGIIIPQEGALAPGDVVSISIPEIGELSNTAVTV